MANLLQYNIHTVHLNNTKIKIYYYTQLYNTSLRVLLILHIELHIS